ncbi:MAG: SRPBCC domain-containing protein, partial [Alphaproteobacteria bacterium]|nr:SRPBCC domain-containing protein [Alphaproteobacteria bacterium]
MVTRQDDGADDGRTTVRRVSDTEMAVTRVFDAPARLVFEAWSNPALFQRWWVPKSLGAALRDCTMDVRTGGTYRLEFGADADSSFAFFGRYLDVVPPHRIVWSNDEGPDGAISTVTLVEVDGRTHLTFSEVYPSKAALEASLGGLDAAPEQFDQLG